MPNLPRKWFDSRTILLSGEWICSSCLHRTQQWTARRRMSSAPVHDGEEDVKRRFLRKVISTYTPKRTATADAETQSSGNSTDQTLGDSQEKDITQSEKSVVQGDQTVNQRHLRKVVPHHPPGQLAVAGAAGKLPGASSEQPLGDVSPVVRGLAASTQDVEESDNQ